MQTERVPLFANPTAGRGRAGRRLPAIVRLFADGNVDIDLRQSTSVGDLEAGVRNVADSGASLIVVAGGDGSIHEAVNGIMKSGTDCTLAVIPTGTGNDFAKAAGIALDWQTAAALLVDRISSNALARRVDVGRMNDRYFANGAGVGLDAKVTRIARSFRLPIGDVVYLLAIFRAMVDGIATPDMRISGDGFEWQGPVTLANVANGPWIGGMFHIAPMADHADRQLDLLVAAAVTRRRIVSLLPKLVNGTHIDEPEISHARVTRLTITSTSALPSHLDGEVGESGTRFEIEILPDALALL